MLIHDQLDGEAVNYLYQAKYLFADSVPELFAGGSKNMIIPPSPATILFYLVFPAHLAFQLNGAFVCLVAYVGMYLLARVLFEPEGKGLISLFVALLFAALPFYTVYGLCVAGQPLLFYALVNLARRRRRAMSGASIAMFGVFSSPTLIGYADAILIVIAVCVCVTRDKSWRRAGGLGIGLCTLLGVYLACNWSLVLQVIMPESSYVSHRTEMVSSSLGFASSFWDVLEHGYYHAASDHEAILIATLVTAALGITFRGKLSFRGHRLVRLILVLLGTCVAIALFYALWHSGPGTRIRNSIGLTTFQFDRFYWLYPVLWYVLLAADLCLMKDCIGHTTLATVHTWIDIIPIAAVGLLAAASCIGNNVLLTASWGQVTGEWSSSSSVATWDDFFAEDLYSEVRDYIGSNISSYRVASVGVYPSVALYNGFYCIDGYSNNYPLDYKQSFRRVIAAELDKSASLESYYDTWGSRCYLFSSELGTRYFFTKDSGVTIKNLEIDAAAAEELGCRYVISGVEIENASDSGMTLMKVFSRDDSIYKLYLYNLDG
jgi:hypothetical protein